MSVENNEYIYKNEGRFNVQFLWARLASFDKLDLNSDL